MTISNISSHHVSARNSKYRLTTVIQGQSPHPQRLKDIHKVKAGTGKS